MRLRNAQEEERVVTAWVVRAEKRGEQEASALAHSCASVGFTNGFGLRFGGAKQALLAIPAVAGKGDAVCTSWSVS